MSPAAFESQSLSLPDIEPVEIDSLLFNPEFLSDNKGVTDDGKRCFSGIENIQHPMSFSSFDDGFHMVQADYVGNEDFVCRVNSPNWLKFYFRLEGSNTILFDGAGEYRADGPRCMVITQPKGLEKADFLGTEGHNSWVTIFLSPDYVVNKLGVDPGGLPKNLAKFLNTGVSDLYCQSLQLSLEMKNIIAEVMKNPYQGPIRKVHSEAKAMELICIMLQNISREFLDAGKSSANLHNSACLEEARAILMESIDNPPTLASLSRQVGLNRSRLSHDFKARFGMTVYDYVTEIRMEQASVMLRNPGVSIGHVAEALGYTHARNFSQAFRRYFGVSPRAARQQY